MTYKYCIPKEFLDKVNSFIEFANGGAQVTILTKSGKSYHEVLISNSSAIVAIHGYDDLPFEISDIKDIYQTEKDKNPKVRNNWHFWDNWK